MALQFEEIHAAPDAKKINEEWFVLANTGGKKVFYERQDVSCMRCHKIAAEGDHKPWCVGLESGEATGWPGTDWVEDFMLRLNGADAYDQWVTHEIPFTLAPGASPLPDDAPGSAVRRLGAAPAVSPLERWLTILFGPGG